MLRSLRNPQANKVKECPMSLVDCGRCGDATTICRASQAVTDVKQVGPDTAKAADVSDLRHSLAELQEAWVSGTLCSILNVLGRPHVELANPRYSEKQSRKLPQKPVPTWTTCTAVSKS